MGGVAGAGSETVAPSAGAIAAPDGASDGAVSPAVSATDPSALTALPPPEAAAGASNAGASPTGWFNIWSATVLGALILGGLLLWRRGRAEPALAGGPQDAQPVARVMPDVAPVAEPAPAPDPAPAQTPAPTSQIADAPRVERDDDIVDAVFDERSVTSDASSAPTPAPAAPDVRSVFVSVPAASVIAANGAAQPAGLARPILRLVPHLDDARTTASELNLTVPVEIINDGSVAAESVLLRVLLQQAHAGQDRDMKRFLDGVGGRSLTEMERIEPGASARINLDLSLGYARVVPIMIRDVPMLIPSLAIDVTYHWDGADEGGQTGVIYAIGSPPTADPDGRLAPFRMSDQARRWPGATLRATGLTRTA